MMHEASFRTRQTNGNPDLGDRRARVRILNRQVLTREWRDLHEDGANKTPLLTERRPKSTMLLLITFKLDQCFWHSRLNHRPYASKGSFNAPVGLPDSIPQYMYEKERTRARCVTFLINACFDFFVLGSDKRDFCQACGKLFPRLWCHWKYLPTTTVQKFHNGPNHRVHTTLVRRSRHRGMRCYKDGKRAEGPDSERRCETR